jgi:hypothetical protein
MEQYSLLDKEFLSQASMFPQFLQSRWKYPRFMGSGRVFDTDQMNVNICPASCRFTQMPHHILRMGAFFEQKLEPRLGHAPKGYSSCPEL